MVNNGEWFVELYTRPSRPSRATSTSTSTSTSTQPSSRREVHEKAVLLDPNIISYIKYYGGGGGVRGGG